MTKEAAFKARPGDAERAVEGTVSARAHTRSCGQLMGSQALRAAVGLACLPLLARNLGPAAYGRCSLFVLVLGLLLWLSALALLGWRLWRGDTLPETQKTAIRRGLVVVLPLAVLLLATAALASAERQAPRAVVLDPIPLAATRGGSTEGPAVAEGVTVRLGDARGSWQAVRLPDGTQGWLPAAALGRL